MSTSGVHTGAGELTGTDDGDRRPPSGVTPRAAIIGLLAVAAFGWLIPYLQDLRSAADLGLGPINPASILTLIILLGPVNGVLLWRWRRIALTREEILTVYAMVAATAAIASVGYITFVTIMTTASQYFATPENRWDILIQQHIPLWIQLNNEQAIRWLWEGLPEGQPVPWRVWRDPLLIWGAIAASIYTGSFCLMSLVRRDWIEAQRLAFPLAQIPLETVGSRGIPGTQLLRQPVFWVGFGIALTHGIAGILHAYWPAVPYHDMHWAIGRRFSANAVPWGALNRIEFNLHWGGLGIMGLLPVEVSLSLWLFHVWHTTEMVTFSALGFGTESGSRYAFDPGAFFSFQTGGALVGFGALVLWQSRRVIAAALRSWWDARWRDDDPLELLRPRYALVGIVLSTALICLIAHSMGAQLSRLLVLLFMFYMTAISLTRVIAAAGTNHVECGPQIRYLLDYGLGTRGARPATYVLLNQMDAVFMTEFKVSFMHLAANDMKIFHASRLRGASVVAALGAAVLVMLVVGSLGRVSSGYHRGIGSFGGWTYDMVPRWEWGDMVDHLSHPQGPNLTGVIAMVSGGAIAGGLSLLQTHVGWWRLSPVGFLLQGGWGINALIWGNALVGWTLVTLIYRFGGLRLYRQVRPAFFGLFLGSAVATLLDNAVRLVAGLPGQAG